MRDRKRWKGEGEDEQEEEAKCPTGFWVSSTYSTVWHFVVTDGRCCSVVAAVVAGNGCYEPSVCRLSSHHNFECLFAWLLLLLLLLLLGKQMEPHSDDQQNEYCLCAKYQLWRMAPVTRHFFGALVSGFRSRYSGS